MKDKSAFLNTCFEWLPGLPPGHSFSLPHTGHAPLFTISLVSLWKQRTENDAFLDIFWYSEVMQQSAMH